MARTAIIGASIVAALSAAIYQSELHLAIVYATGITHTIEPLSAFPYQCHRIDDPRLKSCEDMWLSESTRQLFLACSDPIARQKWMPNDTRFNVSGRGLTDALYALDIDEGIDGTFPVRKLSLSGFAGIPGDNGRIYPSAIRGEELEDGSTRLWIVNLLPSFDYETSTFLEQSKAGANSTVEVFSFKGHKTSSIKHVKTFSHPKIATPNRIAPVGDGSLSFHYTNDHGLNKVGLKYELAPFMGWGDVSFCDEQDCKTVATGHKFPNGLARGNDGLIYVPSSLLGRVSVYKPSQNGSLEFIETIDLGYSLDNISPDKNGDLYVAAFPKGLEILKAYNDPFNSFPPAAATRIRKTESDYEVVKVIEDGLGEILPAATTVLHDATTGRLFFSSVISPFVAVCDNIQ